MERLTMTSDKGGLAFTFDLDINCKLGEMRKIAALGEHLKAYEDLNLTPSEITAALADYEALKAECERLKDTNAVLENSLINAEMNLESETARADKAEAELKQADMCDRCYLKHTVGCHCARAKWRGITQKEG
jgi:hypothetical protein